MYLFLRVSVRIVYVYLKIHGFVQASSSGGQYKYGYVRFPHRFGDILQPRVIRLSDARGR